MGANPELLWGISESIQCTLGPGAKGARLQHLIEIGWILASGNSPRFTDRIWGVRTVTCALPWKKQQSRLDPLRKWPLASLLLRLAIKCKPPKTGEAFCAHRTHCYQNGNDFSIRICENLAVRNHSERTLPGQRFTAVEGVIRTDAHCLPESVWATRRRGSLSA